MKHPRARVLASALLGFGGAAGCRQILDIQEKPLATATAAKTTSSAPAAMHCGGFKQPSADCATCLDSKCCAAATACKDDPTCKPTYACVRECAPDDAECVAWCTGSYARPDTLAALLACASDHCETACGERCGELRSGSNSCDACVKGSCCDENATCSADADCVAFDLCLKRCLPSGSDRCTKECKDQHSKGADGYAARAACVTSACAEACSQDKSWSCLDSPRPFLKPPTLDDLKLEMTVVEYLAGTPYQGLTIKACAPDDLQCDSPRATATTDENGAFTMSIPASTRGFDGYLDLSAVGHAPGDLYPTLYYFRPPLIVGGWRGLLRLPSVQSIGLLVAAMQLTLDDARGHLALVPWDCTLSPASGVAFSVDGSVDGATRYYFSGSAPSTTPTETGGEPSLGGFVNLTPGFRRVTSTVVGTGAKAAELSFIVRAGTLTSGPVPPGL